GGHGDHHGRRARPRRPRRRRRDLLPAPRGRPLQPPASSARGIGGRDRRGGHRGGIRRAPRRRRPRARLGSRGLRARQVRQRDGSVSRRPRRVAPRYRDRHRVRDPRSRARRARRWHRSEPAPLAPRPGVRRRTRSNDFKDRDEQVGGARSAPGRDCGRPSGSAECAPFPWGPRVFAVESRSIRPIECLLFRDLPNGRRESMKRFRLLTVLATVGLLVTACGGSSGGNSSGGGAGKLVIDNESGSTWTCHFNPFNPAVSLTGNGFVYEPLEFVDILKTGPAAVTPWLATSSQWSNGFKTLTFTIRQAVKWSDGQPFSAADVVYTFNAMKRDKAIDLNALWTADGGPLTSVVLKGANQVVFTFSSSSQPYF